MAQTDGRNSGRERSVRFENVWKAFGERPVIQDVSFQIDPGTAFCILGRSGTGKSVTLKLMIGLLKPDSGRIFIEDREISRLESRELAPVRKRMGFLFQSSALFDSINVGDNIAFPLRRHTNLPEDEIRKRVLRRLEEVGLGNEYDKMPAELSGGMRKRAALARALALDPAILLVDEPSSGLDPVTSSEIDELLLSLKADHNTTLVVVTHNIASARRIGDQLAVLHQGRIIAQGAPAEVGESEHEFVRRLMHSEQGG